MKEISRELVAYFISKNDFNFLVIVSNVKGWGLFKIKNKLVLMKNQNLYFFSRFRYLKTSISFLSTYFVCFYRNIFHYLKIKGMGLKIIMLSNKLVFKLGNSHRIAYLCQNNLKINYIHKQLFKVESRSIFNLKGIVSLFTKLKKINSYKKKGIYLKGSIIKLKVSSKKSKV